MATPVGSEWLKQQLKLFDYELTHRSYIGTRNKMEVSPDGSVKQTYGPKYAPAENSIAAHIEFLLKYDDFSLEFLDAVFRKMDEDELTAFISASPNGRYTRKIGFLYEWLIGKILKLEFEPGGNYVDLLDKDRYIVGQIRRSSRWRINDNMLGGPNFCPIVRRTQALEEILVVDLKAEIEHLKAEYSPEIFNRATKYLYRKETKSSYEIEREKPSPDRINRFIAILYQAGKQPAAEVLEESNLTLLQNAIVDLRYAQPGYRDFQNYIGQTSYHMEEIYHYICPPPDMVHDMMDGLVSVEDRTIGISPIIRATIVAFGFVFIHPFLDGNGRIHRFLIHDMLIRDGLAEQGLIIPVSANMVNNLRDYDAALENYSKPLMRRIQFNSASNGEVTVTNSEDVAAYFRYPDLTMQSVYLAKTIQATIQHDLSDELFFLERYDELKAGLQNLIDMPDRRLNDAIVFMHQNKGVFPNRRKKHFPEITEDEFSEMERIYSEIFNDG